MTTKQAYIDYVKLLADIDAKEPFDQNTHGSTLFAIVPKKGTASYSAGRLQTVARRTFMAEIDFGTCDYIVYSDNTPILWHGSFEWLMPSRVQAPGIDNNDYLLMLEIANDLATGDDDDDHT